MVLMTADYGWQKPGAHSLACWEWYNFRVFCSASIQVTNARDALVQDMMLLTLFGRGTVLQIIHGVTLTLPHATRLDKVPGGLWTGRSRAKKFKSNVID